MSALSAKLRQLEDHRVAYWCPGCNQAHQVSVNSGIPGRDWTFNGDVDKPTFSPSVLVTRHEWTPPVTPENMHLWRQVPWEQVDVTKTCHCFVKDGQIQFLADCFHMLANQTVPMPDWPDWKDK